MLRRAATSGSAMLCSASWLSVKETSRRWSPSCLLLTWRLQVSSPSPSFPHPPHPTLLTPFFKPPPPPPPPRLPAPARPQGDFPQSKVWLQATLVHVTKHNDQGSWLGCARACCASMIKPNQLPLMDSFACYLCARQVASSASSSVSYHHHVGTSTADVSALSHPPTRQPSPIIGPIPIMAAPNPSGSTPPPQNQVSAMHQVATTCNHEALLPDSLSRAACIPDGISNASRSASLGFALDPSLEVF